MMLKNASLPGCNPMDCQQYSQKTGSKSMFSFEQYARGTVTISRHVTTVAAVATFRLGYNFMMLTGDYA